MAEAYDVMEEKLHSSVEEQTSLVNQIRELKVKVESNIWNLSSAHSN